MSLTQTTNNIVMRQELKQQLYKTVEQTPLADKTDSNAIAHYFLESDETFFNACEKELSKVNIFYSEKIAKAMRKFASLQHDLAAAFSMDVIEKPSYYAKNTRKQPPKKPSMKKLRRLEVAFSEFYLSLVLLQNYQTLNYSGFRKILKKHDKLFSLKNGEYWRCENVDSASFYINKDTDRLIEETENVVTIYLEQGNRERAMKRLHIPPIDEYQSIWTTFKLGLLIGIFITLFGIIIFTVFLVNLRDYKIALRIYRGIFFIILFLFFIGLNVYGWRTSGVNHILIFEINPRSHLSEQHIMEISMILGILWTLSILGFIFNEHFGLPSYINPLLLMFVMLIFLLNPCRILFHEARFWFFKTMGRIVFAPFFKVNFADFWLAEQLTSLVPVFLDVYFIICFYLSNIRWLDGNLDIKNCMNSTNLIQPVIMCLPAWFRFVQCLRRYYDTKQFFPHIISSIKYVSMFLVIFFAYWNIVYKRENKYFESNLFFYLWMISVILSITFTFTWDVKVDWGLLSGGALENKFLREQIIYSNEIYYFIAVAVNFILRFCWAFSLSQFDIIYPYGDILVIIITPLEIFRRFIWNFFRLENEHLNNCGEFRVIRDISVVPLETADRDQEILLRMMDEQDGVTNRYQKLNLQTTEHDKKIKIA